MYTLGQIWGDVEQVKKETREDDLLTTVLKKRDLQDFFSDLYDKASKWYELGLALGLICDELDKIKETYRDQVNKCLLEMLKLWLSKVSPRPTRGALIRALSERTVGEEAFAAHLKQKYMTQDCNLLEAAGTNSFNISSSFSKNLQSHSPTSPLTGHSSGRAKKKSVKRLSTSNVAPDPKRKAQRFEAFYNGTNYKFTSPLPKDLLCQECHHLALEPQQMKCCGKLYCKSCLKSSVWCINCNDRLSKSSPDVRRDKQIRFLIIKCPNSPNGCPWEGRLGDVTIHRFCCEKEMISCLYKAIGCDEIMCRDEVEKHEKYKWRVHLDQSLRKQILMIEKIEQLEASLEEKTSKLTELKQQLDLHEFTCRR